MENTNSSKFLWTSVIVIILLVVFGIYSAISSTPADGPSQATTIMESLTDDEWTKNATSSAVTLIEYADFQCPGCAGFYPVIKQLQAELGPTFTVVYRHFPLAGHANARIAARAAEAAGKQGKFWQMHDMLFENQQKWEKSGSADKLFIEYAKTLGLDESQFTTDLRSKSIGDKIQAHYDSGVKFGVNSTPTFFVNNKKLAFPRTYEELKNQVQAAINESKNGTSTTATSTGR